MADVDDGADASLLGGGEDHVEVGRSLRTAATAAASELTLEDASGLLTPVPEGGAAQDTVKVHSNPWGCMSVLVGDDLHAYDVAL